MVSMRVDWVEEFLIERIIQLSFRNVKKNMSIKHMIWMRGHSKVQKLFWAVTKTKTSMCYQVLPWGGPSEENKWNQSQHKMQKHLCWCVTLRRFMAPLRSRRVSLNPLPVLSPLMPTLLHCRQPGLTPHNTQTFQELSTVTLYIWRVTMNIGIGVLN